MYRRTEHELGLVARFGRLLRARRRKLGWSQRTLADRCGVSRSTVSRVERGLEPEIHLVRGLAMLDALTPDRPPIAGQAERRDHDHSRALGRPGAGRQAT